jgi:predicted N-acetyltransferase YhbS/predicted enzyme related to lactoylglutathione lyase
MSQPTGPGPRWVGVRVARPVGDLARSLTFYRDLLGLAERGGFTGHEGYDGVFLALPGGAECELTTGPAVPAPGTEEDLLVLYLRSAREVAEAADRLRAAGVPEVRAANPYWRRWGRTFTDPDGYRVVVAAADPGPADVRVELHEGPREALRPLFELAEDSPAELDRYLHAGRVLVARDPGGDVVGHLQLVPRDAAREAAGDDAGEVELTNMAVRAELHGRGVGARLVAAAVDLLARERRTRLVVGTGAADVGNLRFYQRQGFRFRKVERDAFTPATGYPPGILVDGVELRDRVWLDRPIGG